TIALKCLEKDPRKRYATALALAEDLDRFLAGETVQARRASRAERTWRWCRRNPWTAGLTGTVLGLLIVLAVGSLIAAVRLKKSADKRLWEAKFAEARAYRFRDQIGRRFSALEALAEAARIRPAPELRDEAIAALALMDCRPTTPVQGLTGSTGDFDAEHQLFAGIAPTGQVTVRRVQDGSE